jgi:hypothetical protein
MYMVYDCGCDCIFKVKSCKSISLNFLSPDLESDRRIDSEEGESKITAETGNDGIIGCK